MTGAPPLGIVPRQLWLTDRAVGLATAISDYTRSCSDIGVGGEEVADRMALVFSWACELRDVLEEITRKTASSGGGKFQRGGVVSPKLKTGGGFGQWSDGVPAPPIMAPGDRS